MRDKNGLIDCNSFYKFIYIHKDLKKSRKKKPGRKDWKVFHTNAREKKKRYKKSHSGIEVCSLPTLFSFLNVQTYKL